MRNYDTPVRAIRHKVYVEVAKAGFESTDETLIHDIEGGQPRFSSANKNKF